MSQLLVGNLGNGQQLFLEQSGSHTAIMLAQSASGQQQSQRSSFLTGVWTTMPVLLQTAIGWVVQLQAEQGSFTVQIQGNAIQLLADAISVAGTAVPLQPQQAPLPMPPMRPLEPMPPLKMGNMEMQMSPMTLRVGNLEMQMGSTSAETASGFETPRGSKFCRQCGQPVQPEDKFCSQCGHSLR